LIIINANPVAFSIGPFSVHWYGLMYAVGITIGLLVIRPYANYKGITGSQLLTIALWSILAGLIGARLYYVIQQPLGQYLREPWRILAAWEGGMAFYGAIFAVVVTLLITGWRLGISKLSLLDVGGLFAAVGQFFGRIGNIINGDVIGYPTGLPWGFVYANPDSFAPRHDIPYQPAAVYEALINILLFGVLWLLRKKLKPGMLFFIYIICYSMSQIIVFIWRDNEVVFWGLKQAQLTAIAVIIAAVIVYLIVYFIQRRLTTGRAAK
jgi:phosphatidylglycerol:prolipoprotein diacylglycerol transferase